MWLKLGEFNRYQYYLQCNACNQYYGDFVIVRTMIVISQNNLHRMSTFDMFASWCELSLIAWHINEHESTCTLPRHVVAVVTK